MAISKKLQAIELLALGDMQYEQIAATVGVTAATLRRWRADPEFATQVRDRALGLLKDKIPAIYSVLSDKSLKGDIKAIALLLDRVDRAEMDLEKASEGTLTFTWGRKGITMDNESDLSGE